MNFYRYRCLRHFVLLLLAVFVMNTVYANGMMVSVPDQILSHLADDNNQAMHCHHADALNQDAPEKPHHHCKTCNHCLACFSAIPQSTLLTVAALPQTVLAVSFANIYAPPVDIQPQKPPIS